MFLPRPSSAPKSLLPELDIQHVDVFLLCPLVSERHSTKIVLLHTIRFSSTLSVQKHNTTQKKRALTFTHVVLPLLNCPSRKLGGIQKTTFLHSSRPEPQLKRQARPVHVCCDIFEIKDD
jgi:hypothetical protein